jgi:hypothetical protein
VTFSANGTFSFNPSPGFEGTTTFDYTISDGTLTDTGTVALNVSDVIWFVDNSLGANGDGRIDSPFNSLANFVSGAADDAGDVIFLHENGGGNYTGGITLLNNQQLIGQGVDLENVTGLLPPPYSPALPGATSNPTLSGTGITLASGNTVRGLNIGNTTGTGMAGTSVGTLSVRDVTISGSGAGVNINGGTLDVGFDSVSSSNAAGITLNNVSGSFDVAGGTISSGTATAVSIDGNPSVELGVTLTSVSSNAASSGIVLTDTTGYFTVTGDGSTATQGGNGTGGTIQNSTDDGVKLSTSRSKTSISIRAPPARSKWATPRASS